MRAHTPMRDARCARAALTRYYTDCSAARPPSCPNPHGPGRRRTQVRKRHQMALRKGDARVAAEAADFWIKHHRTLHQGDPLQPHHAP